MAIARLVLKILMT